MRLDVGACIVSLDMLFIVPMSILTCSLYTQVALVNLDYLLGVCPFDSVVNVSQQCLSCKQSKRLVLYNTLSQQLDLLSAERQAQYRADLHFCEIR